MLSSAHSKRCSRVRSWFAPFGVRSRCDLTPKRGKPRPDPSSALTPGIGHTPRVLNLPRRPQMRQQQDERDLIGRMRARDGSGVADLAATYGPRIQQLAFRYLKNWEDAEEVAQDVLMKVYRKIDAFRGDAALSSWIYRITFNTAMSRLRSTRASRATEIQKPESNTQEPSERVPATTFCAVRCANGSSTR